MQNPISHLDPTPHLRLARATDATEAAELILMTAERPLRYLFGMGAERAERAFLGRAFASSTGAFSHTHTIVVEVQGVIGGLMIAYPMDLSLAARRALVAQMLRHYTPRHWPRLFSRAWQVGQLLPAAAPDAYYFSTMAVLPSLRHRGLAHLLLAATEAAAWRHGSSRCQMHVAATNYTIRSLLESRGYRTVVHCAASARLMQAGLSAQLLMGKLLNPRPLRRIG